LYKEGFSALFAHLTLVALSGYTHKTVQKGLVLIPLIALGAIALFFWTEQQVPPVSNTPVQTAALSPTAVASPAASSNIEVMSPKQGEKVSSPFMVYGNARVFENVVSIRLSDGEGNVLYQNNVIANAPDVGKFGPFQAKVDYSVSQPQKGILEVFQSSAKDGSEIDKVTLELQLQ
jgi:hypothetical protein